MKQQLVCDMNRLFSVFKNNVELDLHEFLAPTAPAVKFQSEFEEELDDFYRSVMNLLLKELPN